MAPRGPLSPVTACNHSSVRVILEAGQRRVASNNLLRTEYLGQGCLLVVRLKARPSRSTETRRCPTPPFADWGLLHQPSNGHGRLDAEDGAVLRLLVALGHVLPDARAELAVGVGPAELLGGHEVAAGQEQVPTRAAAGTSPAPCRRSRPRPASAAAPPPSFDRSVSVQSGLTRAGGSPTKESPTSCAS